MMRIFIVAIIYGSMLLFAQGQPSKLAGEWTLSYIQVGHNEPEFNPYYVRNGVELRMTDDGKNGFVEGHDMCNRAKGGYTLPAEKRLNMFEIVVSDRACQMDWPSSLWKTLGNLTSYLLVGNHLYLKFDDDKSLMAFERKSIEPKTEK